MLVGQLLALSYLSRLYGPPPGATPLGKVSAVYIGLFLGVGVVGTLVLPAAALGLARTPMFDELQLWRLLTPVFWANGLGLDFALQLWFFGSFSSLLERRHFHNTPFKCDYDGETDMRALYLDLLNQVEDKIYEDEYKIIENNLNK